MQYGDEFENIGSPYMGRPEDPGSIAERQHKNLLKSLGIKKRPLIVYWNHFLVLLVIFMMGVFIYFQAVKSGAMTAQIERLNDQVACLNDEITEMKLAERPLVYMTGKNPKSYVIDEGELILSDDPM